MNKLRLRIGIVLHGLFGLMLVLLVGALLRPIYQDLQQRSKSASLAANVEAAQSVFAALQFVRKITGFHKPSQANQASFLAAVEEVTMVSRRLLYSLETSSPPRNREEEAAKAKARSLERFGT